jgi:hypothetical protein
MLAYFKRKKDEKERERQRKQRAAEEQREWFQVKGGEAVFAIGYLTDSMNEVKGGTGWAVQMAIDAGKPVYVFDQQFDRWFTWEEGVPGKFGRFVECDIPVLTGHFAGVGTREILPNGIEAIRSVYRLTLSIHQNRKP